MSLCFYYEGLKDVKNASVRAVKYYEINLNSFFIIDDKEEKFYLYLAKGKSVQELDYNLHKENFYETLKEIKRVEIMTSEGKIVFYTSKNMKHIIFAPDTEIKEANGLACFKEEYLTYKDYDIEWCGDFYQVSDYMTKKVVSLSPDINQVYKDIDEFLIWKNAISTDPKFYEEKGFVIRVIPTNSRYPAFPFTYEIDSKKDGTLSFPGISNVFETEKEAMVKACYKCHDMLTNKHF